MATRKTDKTIRDRTRAPKNTRELRKLRTAVEVDGYRLQGVLVLNPFGRPQTVPVESIGGGGGTDAVSGYWTPITNGDPVTPELLFDSNGDCVVGFVPTTE